MEPEGADQTARLWITAADSFVIMHGSALWRVFVHDHDGLGQGFDEVSR